MADRRGTLRHSVPGDAAPACHPPDPASPPADIRLREPGRPQARLRGTRAILPAAGLYRGPAIHRVPPAGADGRGGRRRTVVPRRLRLARRRHHGGPPPPPPPAAPPH